MSRARHRLTTRQNLFQSKKRVEEVAGVFDAFFDADTYIWDVAGPITGGFEVGADSHTGGSSDAYLAAQFIQDQTSAGGIHASGFIEVGCNQVEGDLYYDAESGLDIEIWPYYFNYIDLLDADDDIDGWLSSPARRALFYMDLSTKGPLDSGGNVQPIPSTATINSATLILTVNQTLTHNWPDFSSIFELSRPRQYNIYKSLKGFGSANIADVNWYGWTGGNEVGATVDPATDYWAEPGGGSYGGDITELGVSAGLIAPNEFGDTTEPWANPIAAGYGADGFARYGGGLVIGDLATPKGDKSTIQNAVFLGALGGSDQTLEFDITHLVQDAIDNESMILRLVMIGYIDTDMGVGNNDEFYFYYDQATHALRLYSSEHVGDEYLKPHVRIDFS